MSESLQRPFAEDLDLVNRLFDLLAAVFPDLELRQLANAARELGAPWESVSTPFMKFEGNRVIAHVGVLELPLQVMGQPVQVGGIHAVATHPDFRRQGHYRDCMEAALAYCDSRYETLLLTTSQPELYKSFGFRVVPESAFVASCQVREAKPGMRILELQNADDRALLHRLLDTRIPISDVVGVYPERALFLVNEASRPLYYIPDLDALVVMQMDQQLHLFEIVSPHSLSLRSILEYIHDPVTEVVLYFSPDRLNIHTQTISCMLDETYLMMRGSFAAENQPFMLPHPARC